jgi:anti-anti-sigma regulatory factor
VLETAEGVVVRLRGEAGATEAHALEASLLRLIARRPAGVTFDLSELVGISSLALGVLEAFRHANVRAGARVCLAADLHPAVRAALNRAEMTSLFEAVGRPGPSTGPTPSAEDARKLYPNVYDLERAYRVTWSQLVELEPQVERLLWQARLAGAKWRPFTHVERIFGPVRDELAGLLGFAGKYRKHPVLGSAGAYAVAYRKLYEAVAGPLPGPAGGAAGAPENQSGPEI